MVTKVCAWCKKKLVSDEYGCYCSDECRESRSRHNKERYKLFKEAIKNKTKKYREENPEKVKEYNKNYRELHKEELREYEAKRKDYKRKWHKENKAKAISKIMDEYLNDT